MKKIVLFTLLLNTQFLWSQTCSGQLDNELAQIPQWLIGSRNQDVLPKKCIQISMNIFNSWAQQYFSHHSEHKGFYLYCSETEKVRNNTPPCQSEVYMNSIGNSFDAISQCLDIDPGMLYPVISAESGFYHNSFSQSGTDIGFGQLTAPAISDISDQWEWLIDDLKGSARQSCRNIISFIESKELRPIFDELDCSLTRAPENPFLNALYTGLHFKLITSYMNNYFESNDVYRRLKNYFSKNYSQELALKIKKNLILLAYNLGHNGAVNAFEQFMQYKEKQLSNGLSILKKYQGELAQLKIKIKKSNPIQRLLLTPKKEAKEDQILKIKKNLAPLQLMSIFNGNEVQGSFGEFIIKNNISGYLRVLSSRVISINSQGGREKCPTKDFLAI